MKHNQTPLNESWEENQLPPDIFLDVKYCKRREPQKKSKAKSLISPTPEKKSPEPSRKKHVSPTSIFDELRKKKK